jgi:AcrR family transcriptional regulator
MPKVTEEHKEARRRQIAAAALKCFGRDGFHGTTMQQIIDAAGLSAGAVYTYFASKEDLILYVAKTSTSGFAELVEAQAGAEPLTPPSQALPDLADQAVAYLRQGGVDKAAVALQGWAEATRNPAIRRVAQASMNRVRAAMEQWLGRWRQAGLISPEVDPQTAAAPMVSLLLGLLIQRALWTGLDHRAYAQGAAKLIELPPQGD